MIDWLVPSQLVFYVLTLVFCSVTATYEPHSHTSEVHPNGTLSGKSGSPIQHWWPDMQVVIDDDNQIKIERKSDVAKQSTLTEEPENDNSLMHLFGRDNPEMAPFFESKRFKPLQTQHATNNTEEEFGLTKWSSPINFGHDNRAPTTNRYSQKTISPSFSKIPDFISEQIMASDVQSTEVELPKVTTNPGESKTLVVPVGSRVHTIRYEDDYTVPESSEPAREHYGVGKYSKSLPYTGNIIEVPSSKPILPVIFNFRSKSSPIITTQSHFKLANSQPSVQYKETNEPPQIYEHVVHKPIYQDLHEFMPIYRVYYREIKPVQEYMQTYIYKDANSKDLPYSSMPQSSYPTRTYPVYAPIYPTATAPQSTSVPQPSYQNTMPTYNSDSGNSLPSSYEGYSSMVHRNPYMDISYRIPYRIQDLYKKPLGFEPKYLSMNNFNKFNK